MKKMLNNSKGITLIALVVTIVVLLILAGVSISTLTGDNGIIKQSQEAKERTKYEGAKEKFDLVILDVRAGKLEKNQKFLLSDSLAAEIESYEEIESATFVGEKIEAIVDGYTFEVAGDVEENRNIEKVEGSTDKWGYYVEDGYAVLNECYIGPEDFGVVEGVGFTLPTEVVVPNYIDGYWVKGVEGSSGSSPVWTTLSEYSDGTHDYMYLETIITKLIISEGIEEISENAFAEMVELEQVFIPKTVTKIQPNAFYRDKEHHEAVYEITVSDFTMNVEYEENEIPAGWSSDWNSYAASVNYGVTMP